MPLPIYRLRRWLAVIAVLFTATVSGMYFYARLRQRNVLKEIPNKIGIDIKQTANGFQFSKSDGKRTLFTVQAGSLKQFQLDGSAELHNVSVILYGRDSSRFDQIYGDDFSYDKKSGNITAHGDVQIDLESNPTGETGPDQGTPRELKNPIHLETTDLVFNQNSGDASTDARVDFRTPQATGSAMGVQYSGKTNTLTLVSQVHVTHGRAAGRHAARHSRHNHARPPRSRPGESPLGACNWHRASRGSHIFSRAGERSATHPGHRERERRIQRRRRRPVRARADEAEMLLIGKQNLLRTATLTGNVHVERIGSQPMQGDAGRAILDFLGRNKLEKVHATDGVRLAQHPNSTTSPATDTSEHASQRASEPQDFDLTAPTVDFFIADGNRLDHAETSGAAKITISPAQNSNPATAQASAQHTVVTAGRFDAKFAATPDGSSRLTSIHGAPDAKIVNFTPELPDRVSTSQTLDALFLPQGGIASIIQKGNVAYDDGQVPSKRTQAWAEKAVYTPADRILVLTGSPRVSEGSMVTTARTIRINRATDDAFADEDVKSTYSELQEQPNGALLASASPIHVTSATMTAHNSPAVALYRGNARLWQDANIVEAPSIQFDRSAVPGRPGYHDPTGFDGAGPGQAGAAR